MFAWQPEEFIQRDVEKDISGDGRRIAGERAGRGTIKKRSGSRDTVSVSQSRIRELRPLRFRFNDKGHAVYSLAVIGEENRMRQKGLDAIRQELVRVARSLGRERHYIGG